MSPRNASQRRRIPYSSSAPMPSPYERQTSIVSSWPPPGWRASDTAAPASRSASAARATISTVSAVGEARPFSDRRGDPQAAQLDRRGVAERHRRRAAVAPVRPGEHAEEQRDVGDRAGQRPDLRARVTERADLPEVVEHAGDRHAPRGRLDRRQPAEVGGQAHAGARVRAHAAWRAARRDRGRLAAAAAARRALEVPRVVRAPVHLVVGFDAAAVDRAVGLPEQDRARAAQPRHRRRVAVGHHADALRRADRHLHPRRRQVVLGGERHAVQRAARLAAGERGVRLGPRSRAPARRRPARRR